MAGASLCDLQPYSLSQFNARFRFVPSYPRVCRLLPAPGFQTQTLEFAVLRVFYGWPERANVATSQCRRMILRAGAAATTRKRKAFYPGENKGFVEEMRFVAMKLHTKDQSEEGEKEADEKPVATWQPSVQGYLKFLVDSKTVYDTMESIVETSLQPIYANFANTGLKRAGRLEKDLKWFKRKGHAIPEPGEPGLSYACYLKALAEKDPPAFVCHFYNVHFAHWAGGRIIGKQVADKILNGRELEFYKWDGDFKVMLADVKQKLNKVAEGWTREEKKCCLKETEKSFRNSGKILRLIIL